MIPLLSLGSVCFSTIIIFLWDSRWSTRLTRDYWYFRKHLNFSQNRWVHVLQIPGLPAEDRYPAPGRTFSKKVIIQHPGVQSAKKSLGTHSLFHLSSYNFWMLSKLVMTDGILILLKNRRGTSTFRTLFVGCNILNTFFILLQMLLFAVGKLRRSARGNAPHANN